MENRAQWHLCCGRNFEEEESGSPVQDCHEQGQNYRNRSGRFLLLVSNRNDKVAVTLLHFCRSKSMKCSYCGAKLTDDSAFCKRCGFHSYGAWVIARQQSLRFYLAGAVRF